MVNINTKRERRISKWGIFETAMEEKGGGILETIMEKGGGYL